VNKYCEGKVKNGRRKLKEFETNYLAGVVIFI